ncbi:MAG: hypothetical protein ABIQ09_13930 [Jatrophihabitantaceae bacterium]
MSTEREPGVRAAFFSRRQHSRWRWLTVPAMLIAAAAHLPVIAPHLTEAPYIGVLFVVLSAACVGLASVAISWDPPVVYALSALTCGLAVLGYAATRLVAFPLLADDVGYWLEPLGILSIASEGIVVLTALIALNGWTPKAVAARPALGLAA